MNEEEKRAAQRELAELRLLMKDDADRVILDLFPYSKIYTCKHHFRTMWDELFKGEEMMAGADPALGGIDTGEIQFGPVVYGEHQCTHMSDDRHICPIVAVWYVKYKTLVKRR